MLTSGVGFDCAKTEHINTATEARNDRYDVDRIHVEAAAARLDQSAERGSAVGEETIARVSCLPNIRYRVAEGH